ncbi:flagellar motor protein MotB [Bacillus salipaludis]|uniref:flagellar motor protein MotB n=1 Tax=Bacillus salipaludis TaxID=2547811 RepID=UPI003D21F333
MRKSRRKFDEEHEEHMDEAWLLPYSDLLTLLLALFIVLFAASSINKSKYEAIMESFKSELSGTQVENSQVGLAPTPATVVQQQKPPVQSIQPVNKQKDVELDKLKEKLEAYIEKNHLHATVTLQNTKRGVEVTLKDVILFDPGKADLKKSSFKTLNAIVGLMKTVPNPISIEGHTDNVPIGNAAFSSNWELSSARAVSVLHYFELKHISHKRLQFTGYGEYKPIYRNDTKEHRQANRRVNIVVLRNT